MITRRHAIGLLALLPVSVRARDDGRYAQQSPALREWFDNLRNNNGNRCCSDADGRRVEDPDWEALPEGRYKVRLVPKIGQWHTVEPAQVVRENNKVGYAVVWRSEDYNGQETIICFMPGSSS